MLGCLGGRVTAAAAPTNLLPLRCFTWSTGRSNVIQTQETAGVLQQRLIAANIERTKIRNNTQIRTAKVDKVFNDKERKRLSNFTPTHERKSVLNRPLYLTGVFRRVIDAENGVSRFICDSPPCDKREKSTFQRAREQRNLMRSSSTYVKTALSSVLQKRSMSEEEIKKAGTPPPRHFLSKESHSTAPRSSLSKLQVTTEPWESETTSNLPHPVWSEETVKAVTITHFKPRGIVDGLAYLSVRTLRAAFDLVSGYALGFVDENGWLNRIVFLETVAGVPGLVGAMVRHLKSLRRMERDYGWIHTLLEEAENERMHLMSALQLKKPGLGFRLFVLVTQGIFLPFFTLAYLVSPRYCHRFVGYLEEEAVKTYSKLLKLLEHGDLPAFQNLKAPLIARQYWELQDDATFTDMIYAIRGKCGE